MGSTLGEASIFRAWTRAAVERMSQATGTTVEVPVSATPLAQICRSYLDTDSTPFVVLELSLRSHEIGSMNSELLPPRSRITRNLVGVDNPLSV